jgi:DNA-binding transcriptional MerR regulator
MSADGAPSSRRSGGTGPPSVDPPRYRIGEAADRAGVSSGGARRYSEDDLARIVQIRELQGLLGLDLGEIRDILQGEDALAGLRREYHTGPEATRRREILVEASAINQKLRAVVSSRQELLSAMLAALHDKAARYAELLTELDSDRQ